MFVLNELHIKILEVYYDNQGGVPPTYAEVASSITIMKKGRIKNPSGSSIKQYIDVLCASEYLDRKPPLSGSFSTRSVIITQKGREFIEGFRSDHAPPASRKKTIIAAGYG